MIGHFKTLIKKLHSRKSALNAHFRELISIALCKTKTQLPDKGQLIFLAASPGIPLDPVRLIRQYSFRIQNDDNVIFFLRTVRDSYLDPQTHATHRGRPEGVSKVFKLDLSPAVLQSHGRWKSCVVFGCFNDPMYYHRLVSRTLTT